MPRLVHEPGVPNSLVEITNLTATPFDNLWYVADPETRFSNVDGFVNDQEAFKIDAVDSTVRSCSSRAFRRNLLTR